MMNNICILGGGGHAKVIISIIKQLSEYSLIGYSDLYDRGPILGVPFYKTDDQLMREKGLSLALGLSYGLNVYDDLRNKVLQKFYNSQFKFPVIISPNSYISENVEIGEGTIIMNRSLLNASSKVGRFCVVNSSAILEHDVVVGDFSQISPAVVLCGGVKIGYNCFVGAGSVVNDGITICSNVVIGSGSVVVSDIEQEGTYLGVPARRLNKN